MPTLTSSSTATTTLNEYLATYFRLQSLHDRLQSDLNSCKETAIPRANAELLLHQIEEAMARLTQMTLKVSA